MTDENRLDPKAQATPAQGQHRTASAATPSAVGGKRGPHDHAFDHALAFVSATYGLRPEDLEWRSFEDLQRLAADALSIPMPSDGTVPRWDDEVYVQDRVRRKHLDAEAQRRFDADVAALAGRGPAVSPQTLRDVLALPPEPEHRIEQLIPAEASTLIVAMRKTGKTTLILNLAASLLSGEPFLGKFSAEPVASTATVAILNYEVSGRQLARWARDVDLDLDRLLLVNLRGSPNPLSNPLARQALAEQLRQAQVESLIVDPFGRAFTGKDQNSAADVGAFLQDLDLFARGEAGAKDLILTTHAGWSGERSRGSTALEDWPDAIITLTRDPKSEDNGPRFLKAMGRDVDLDEDQLAYDPRTRRLTLTGNGSKRDAEVKRKVIDLGVHVERVVKRAGPNGISTTAIRDLLRQQSKAEGVPSFQDRDVNTACTHLVEQGLIAQADGYRLGLAKVYVSTAKA